MITLASTMVLGLVACGAAKNDASKSKAKPSAATSSEEAEYDEVALAAMVSTEMETLSDHRADGDPEVDWTPQLPYRDCPYLDWKSLGQYVSAYQELDGDPGLSVSAYVYPKEAASVYSELREFWTSKECESFEDEVDDTYFTFKRTQTIEAPKGVKKKSWFGACFAGEEEAQEYISGRCSIVYLHDDDSFVEVETNQHPDENEINAAFLTLMATEALNG